MAITTLNNRSINRSDTASADQVWTATSATASDFQAGGVTGVTTGSGNVTISNGNLILGTSGKGIDFSATGDASTTGSSMTAEVLDDYEEGTFTLATSGITYVRNTGYYRKIGALVYIQCYLTVDTYTSGTRVSIEGLPFASKNIAAYDGHHPISIARWDNLHISTIAIYPKVGSGGTSIGCDSIASSADGVTGNVEIFGDDATMRFGGCYPVD